MSSLLTLLYHNLCGKILMSRRRFNISVIILATTLGLGESSFLLHTVGGILCFPRRIVQFRWLIRCECCWFPLLFRQVIGIFDFPTPIGIRRRRRCRFVPVGIDFHHLRHTGIGWHGNVIFFCQRGW